MMISMENVVCFYNYIKDEAEEQIIILLPDNGFVMWKPQPNYYGITQLNPYLLFKRHYLEAKYKSRKRSNKSFTFNLSKINIEIDKAWDNADAKVYVKYTELTMLLNSLHNLTINFLMDFHLSQQMIYNNDFVLNNGKIASKDSLNRFISLTIKEVTIIIKKNIWTINLHFSVINWN